MLNCLNTPLQITIVRSYRAAMFVLHADTYKARAIFAPRSPTVKKYYEASLSGEITRKHPLEILRLKTLQISLLCFGLSISPPPPPHLITTRCSPTSWEVVGHESDCQSCKPYPALEKTSVHRRVKKSTILTLDL